MTKSRGFLSNAMIFGIGGAATQIVSALLLPFYTHYLMPEDFGILDLLQRTGSIVVLLLLGHGIRMATFAFYCQAKSPGERQQVFSTIAVILGLVLLLGGLAGVALAPWLARVLEIENPRLVTLGITVVLLEAFTTFPIALMQARADSLRYVGANLLMALCRIVLIIAAVAWLDLGVWGVLAASAITFAMVSAGLFYRESLSGFPFPDLAIAKHVVAFALPLLPSGLMGLALAGADRYYLVAYTSTREVGLYALGAKLAMMVPGLAIDPLWKVWTAVLYDYYAAADAAERVGRIVLRILAVQVFLALGVSIFSRELVALIAPASYAAAALVVPLLAVAGSCQLANNLFEGTFWSQRKTKWKPWLMACSAAVAVIAFSVLVPRWGSWGAAAALALAYSVHACLTFKVTQRIFAVKYDWREAAAAVGMAIALYVTSLFAGATYPWLAVKAVLWLAWPGIIWMSGIVSDEEQQWCLRQATRGRQLAVKWLSAATS